MNVFSTVFVPAGVANVHKRIPMFSYLFRIILFLRGCQRLSGCSIISVEPFKAIFLS